MQEVTIENYSHLDSGVLVDSNGEKYAVGVDETGYLTILSGGLHQEKDNVFWVEKPSNHIMIPKHKLVKAIEQL